MPAPPPESEPAIVKQRGIVMRSLRRNDPDQVLRVCSQPWRQGTPVAQGYHRLMAVRTTLWGDLLEGEELAYLGSEPAREARSVPVPTDVPAAIRDALAAQG